MEVGQSFSGVGGCDELLVITQLQQRMCFSIAPVVFRQDITGLYN